MTEGRGGLRKEELCGGRDNRARFCDDLCPFRVNPLRFLPYSLSQTALFVDAGRHLRRSQTGEKPAVYWDTELRTGASTSNAVT